MPRRAGQIGIARDQLRGHQLRIDKGRLQPLAHHRRQIDPRQHRAADRIGEQAKDYRPARLFAQGAAARGIDQHEAIQSVAVAQRIVPRHRAAHRIARQHELAGDKPRHHAVNQIGIVIGVGGPVGRRAGQPVAGQIERDDPIARAQPRDPAIPVRGRGGKTVNQHQHRPVAAPLVAIAHRNALAEIGKLAGTVEIAVVKGRPIQIGALQGHETKAQQANRAQRGPCRYAPDPHSILSRRLLRAKDGARGPGGQSAIRAIAM